MTFGIQQRAGVVWPSSQFVMVVVSTQICSATSRCKSPRSSRRLRRWSPSVRSCLGYPGEGGFCPRKSTWQKGNAGMRVSRPQHHELDAHIATRRLERSRWRGGPAKLRTLLRPITDGRCPGTASRHDPARLCGLRGSRSQGTEMRGLPSLSPGPWRRRLPAGSQER